MTRLNLRLLPCDAAALEDLQARLATPLRPAVTGADVLRAGMIALRDRLDAGARA